ncbi:transposase [Glycomyces sp. NPDC049804]|uniref:transposase n=1 Tax=Glycomyces sp. NPDC049804 TaxID=3154363 RepID=UPI0034359A86
MTSKYQRRFPEEFKDEAVRAYLDDPTATYASVAKNLGVSGETLRNWVKQHRKQQGASPRYQAPTSENEGLVGYDAVIAEENRRLRAELEKVKAERDILRKAAKYFAGETNW